MKKVIRSLLCLVAFTGSLQAQEAFVGGASVGSSEPLYRYDDQERWKHGYLQIMPYYHGWHSFRPYNYHHVFNQSQTAAGWGMSPAMPYSQQFWHKYENMTDLSQGHHSLVSPNVAPTPVDSHYPTQINGAPQPQYGSPLMSPTPAQPNMIYPQPPMQQMHHEVPQGQYTPQPGYGYQQPQMQQGPILPTSNNQLQGYLRNGQ